MASNDFRIIECTSTTITVSREPQTPEEWSMMKLAVMDKKGREFIQNSENIEWPE